MSDLVQDVRFAVRSLAKNPAVTTAVIASLAVGIGANTVVFSLIDTLLLRGVPGLAHPHELVAVFSTAKDRDQNEVLRRVTHGDYLDYATASGVFSGLAAVAGFELSLTHDGPSERVGALAVSDDYFAVLGVVPAHGRLFAEADDAASAAVVSHGFWQRRFGGDPGVLGRSIRLNGHPVRVIGVLPAGFRGTALTGSPEIWLTLDGFRSVATGIYAQFGGAEDRRQAWLDLVGRLAPGVTLAEARSALEVVRGRLAEAYPETHAERGVRVLPLAEVALGTGNREKVLRYSGLLMALVAVVLLVACLDVASLLLARALARRQEVAIRLSLGSSRGRLIRTLLVESLVLALAGGAAGVVVAGALLPLVRRLRLPVDVDLSLALDGRVLAFALAVSLVCGLAFGLVPAVRSARTDLVTTLRGEAPLGRRFRFGLHEGLVTLQVALALVVLIGSGLMIRTLRHLHAIDPGYAPERTLVASLDLASAGYEGPAVTAFYEELTERLRRLPGVEAVSTASALPMAGAEMMVQLSVTVDGAAPRPEGEPPPGVYHAMVGRGYFETVGMELVAGRDFDTRDTSSSAAVLIVNDTMARLFWGRASPLGRRLTLLQSTEPFEVVGVVATAKHSRLKEEPSPVLYLFHAQQEKSFIGPLLAPSTTLLVRASGEAVRLLPEVRRAVQALDAHLPVFGVTTLEAILAKSVAIERQVASLFSAFALVAHVLVMVGLYALVAQAATRRRREIGIRVACGARPASVLRLILRRGVVLSGIGVVLGTAAAVFGSRLVAGYLYGVTATDPATYGAVALALIAMTLAVTAGPARRAARIDPVEVLREE